MADAFEDAWVVLRGRDYNSDNDGDSVSKRDKIGFTDHFAGLSASPLTEFAPLGVSGMAGPPKQRGHEVHSFDWGLDEKGKKDAGLKQGDETYHIDDIMEGSASQVADRMIAPFDAECINPTFGAPCKAFSLAGEPVGWKPNRDTMEMIWEIVHGNKDFPTVTDDDLENPKVKGKYPFGKKFISGVHDPNKALGRHSTPESIAMQNSKVKEYLNRIRGREGGWGFPVYEPRTVDELMFHEDEAHPLLAGEPRFYGRGPVSEKRATDIRARKDLGRATMQRAADIIREFERRKRMGFGFIENPKGQMRYMDEISHLPMTNISAASYRDPPHSKYLGLPSEDSYFDMGEYNLATNPNAKDPLPPFKSTDLFGPLPPTMFIRPPVPRDIGSGKLYASGVRGSQNALQGMKGLPANALFPGSPPISAYHIKSMLPAHLGNDFAQAVEQYFGIEAPNEEFRGTNINDILRQKFGKRGEQTTLNQWHGVDLDEIDRFSQRE